MTKVVKIFNVLSRFLHSFHKCGSVTGAESIRRAKLNQLMAKLSGGACRLLESKMALMVALPLSVQYFLYCCFCSHQCRWFYLFLTPPVLSNTASPLSYGDGIGVWEDLL